MMGIPFISNTDGEINILGENIIGENSFSTALIMNGQLNIIGNNTFYTQTGTNGQTLDVYSGLNILIEGTNTFMGMKHRIIYTENCSIIGNNKFIQNKNKIIDVYARINTLNTSTIIIQGTNTFENNTNILIDGENWGCLTIEGTNIFSNNHLGNNNLICNLESITINGSNIFTNNTGNSLIIPHGYSTSEYSYYAESSGNCTINGSNIFENNQLNTALLTLHGFSNTIQGSNIFNNNTGTNGGVILLTGTNLTITNTTFSNNTAEKGGAIYLNNRENETSATITNNIFINNTAQEGGAIYLLNQSETYKRDLIITNNTFINIKSDNETLNIATNTEKIIENNTYTNCTIALNDFKVESELDGQTVLENTQIPITITTTLEHPEYYDADILDNTEYQLFINEENTINTTETEITYTPEEYGTYNIYAYNPLFNVTSNNITINVNRYDLEISPTIATVGQTINITATIKLNNETMTDLSKGKVVFKLNGKTLKDDDGKVIYAKVINGTATIENYTVPDTWKEGSTIQAVYSGSSQCEKLTSEKTNITVSKAIPTLTTEDITATVSGTITLKATITDKDKLINTGKIVFKINGKTVKDANGKVIYAKVVNNTVTVEYTLPEDMKAKDYTITATFISPDYDKLTDEKTLKITA